MDDTFEAREQILLQAFLHRCSVKAAWIPAFAGMTAKRNSCHSREGGNPLIFGPASFANSLTGHGWAFLQRVVNGRGRIERECAL